MANALNKVNSGGIEDGSIVNADIKSDAAIAGSKLADNAVGLAQMASGTDGQIITYDASGDPIAVGPGTDGQVLTSTGAGSPPAFETLPTSGAVLTGSTNNTITTVTSANNIQGEANLTYDGDILSVGTGSGGAVLKVQGAEGGNAEIWLQTDEGDDDADNWLIYHTASDNKLKLASKPTGSYTDKLTIDSSGKVGINEASPVNLLTISNTAGQDDAIGNLQIRYTGTNNNANSGLTVKNYRGTSQFMQWDGNGVRIGSRILTNSGAGNIYFTCGSDSVKATLVNSNGNLELGGGGNVVLGNGAGIDFSATSGPTGTGSSGTSELFDDYEEGTWDPAAAHGSFSYENGKYTKIGRMVFATYEVTFSATSGSGHQNIGGLPYAAAQDSGVAQGYNNNGASFITHVAGSAIWFYAADGSSISESNCAGKNFRGTAVYYVA